jgi:hypothetical protein
MYILNIFLSIATFIVFFILLQISISFWGRLILKLLKIKTPSIDMLTISAGLVFIVAIAQYLFPYLDNYNLYLTSIYIVGLLCSAVELYFQFLLPLRSSQNKIDILKNNFLSHKTFLKLIIYAIIISFFYSAVWPSGKMDIWMNNGADYYSWVFFSEYLLGNVNTSTFEIDPIFNIITNYTFGTYIIFDLIAIAWLKTPLMASSAFIVVLLVWICTIISNIIEKLFLLNYFESFILALLFTCGMFLNYIAMSGMFGHLLATTNFLIALEQIVLIKYSLKIHKELLKKLFSPLFLIFLAYESGFFIYSFMLISILILSFFINNYKITLKFNFFQSIIQGFRPVIICTLVYFLLMPGITYHLFLRTFEVINQIEGWSLPFLSPLLFTGLPIYIKNQFIVDNLTDINLSDNSILYYIPLFVITILLTIFNVYKTNNEQIYHSSSLTKPKFTLLEDNLSLIISLTSCFIVSLLLYLLAFKLYGNIYRVWKWAAITALPISFIPLTLLIIAIKRFPIKIIFKLQTFVLLTICSILLFKLNFLSSLRHFPTKYFRVYSAMPFINILQKLNNSNNIPKNSTILLHFQEPSRKFLTAVFFKNSNKYKIKFISGIYFFMSHYDFFDLINKSTFIISDINYTNLFNAEPIKSELFKLFVYDYNKLQSDGYITINTGRQPFDWKTYSNDLYAKIKIPNKFINKKLRLKITLTPEQKQLPGCNNIRLGIVNDNNITWSIHDYTNITTIIEENISKLGIISTVIIINNEFSTNLNSNQCIFNIGGYFLEGI